MRRMTMIAVFCLLPVAGCTSEQLRSNTLNQTASLPDIQHQVVLTNLATFAYDPYAIPFHATPSDGTTQIQDNGSITSQLLVATSRTLELGLSRTAVDQWSMAPVTESISLRLLRAAYRRAFDPLVDLYSPDVELANDLAHELKKQTTTVDDLRTTNQVGNAGLQAATTASDMTGALEGMQDLVRNDVNQDPDQRLLSERVMALVGPPAGGAAMDDAERIERSGRPEPSPGFLKTIDNGFREVGSGLNRIGRGLDKVGNDVNGGLKGIGTSLDQLADKVGSAPSGSTQPAGVAFSSKVEPNVVGFGDQSITKFLFESASVLSSNDDQIILPDEFLGRDPGPVDSRLYQVKFPGWTAEKIDLDVGQDQLQDFAVMLSDPGRNQQPLRLSFGQVIKQDVDLSGLTMDGPADATAKAAAKTKAKSVRASFRKLKLYLDAELQKYYESVDAAVSFAVEDYDYKKNRITKVSLVVSFPRRLAGYPNKLVGHSGLLDIPSHDYPRYMATTPLVAELRRQVAEVERTMVKIPSGWLRTSRDKHAVPKDVCYKIRTSDCKGPIYAWVCPGDKAAFEDFTIAILELSAVIKNVNLSGAAGVKFTPGSGAPTLSGGK